MQNVAVMFRNADSDIKKQLSDMQRQLAALQDREAHSEQLEDIQRQLRALMQNQREQQQQLSLFHSRSSFERPVPTIAAGTQTPTPHSVHSSFTPSHGLLSGGHMMQSPHARNPDAPPLPSQDWSGPPSVIYSGQPLQDPLLSQAFPSRTSTGTGSSPVSLHNAQPLADPQHALLNGWLDSAANSAGGSDLSPSVNWQRGRTELVSSPTPEEIVTQELGATTDEVEARSVCLGAVTWAPSLRGVE